jgi:hypothetical protein
MFGLMFEHTQCIVFTNINKFVLYNTKETQSWVALYEENKRKCDNDREEFRELNNKNMHYPSQLKNYVNDLSQCLYVISVISLIVLYKRYSSFH